MQVTLCPGEYVDVTFAETDGTIRVAFLETAIFVNADMPDSTGREGQIYREDFSDTGRNDKIAVVLNNEPALNFNGFLNRG